MSRITRTCLSALALLAALFLAGVQAGCADRNLFADNDPALRKVKYWDNESVGASRNERRDAREAGFGYAQGPADQ